MLVHEWINLAGLAFTTLSLLFKPGYDIKELLRNPDKYNADIYVEDGYVSLVAKMPNLVYYSMQIWSCLQSRPFTYVPNLVCMCVYAVGAVSEILFMLCLALRTKPRNKKIHILLILSSVLFLVVPGMIVPTYTHPDTYDARNSCNIFSLGSSIITLMTAACEIRLQPEYPSPKLAGCFYAAGGLGFALQGVARLFGKDYYIAGCHLIAAGLSAIALGIICSIYMSKRKKKD
ncbi:hypothetical protein LINGRAHAP2_LOCUS8989 [Linum grandiflorum]